MFFEISVDNIKVKIG